ncbi:E3 SUMO-protein ligase ZBED1-like [Hydra vulgaris]|uniref:E3 SUMO-protein ligase ZBED1-like n=1 Tax=Hydra vulgaris TaxID=6087 RepID=A0ABM4B8P2_HYDVU
MVRPKGPIWKYFNQDINDVDGKRIVYAKCKHCTVKIQTKQGNTSGMRQHMCRHHPVLFRELEKTKFQDKVTSDAAYDELGQVCSQDDQYEAQREASDARDPEVLNRSVRKRKLISPCKAEQERPMDKYKKWKPQDPEQLRQDLEITKMIARTNLPFSFVETYGFREYAAFTTPKYTIKSATTYSRSKLPLLYKNVKREVNLVLDDELVHAPQFGLSTDLWQSRNNDPYMAVTVHYINLEFQLKMFVIGAFPFSERYTGETIANKLDFLVSTFPGNSGAGNVACTHDNASNMIAVIPKCKNVNHSLRCADHLLNLAVTDSIDSCKEAECLNLSDALERATALVSKCHKSYLCEARIEKEVKAMKEDDELENTDDLVYVKLIAPAKTRWNSHFFMLQSIYRMRRVLLSIKYSGNDPTKMAHLIPTEDEFDLFDEILPMLERINDVSQSFSAEKSVIICKVIAHIYSLKHRAQQAVQSGTLSSVAEYFFKKFIKNLMIRFPDSGTKNIFYAVGCILNPLYQGNPLKKIGGYEAAYDALITKNFSHREWLASLESSRNSPPVDNPELQDMDDPFFEIIKKPESEVEVSSTVPAKSKIQTEWEMFSAMPATKQPVLEFWRDNKDKFPLLSEAARKLLCIPASSAPCERIFSAGGNIVSAKKTKLQPENVEKLIYIQQNIDRITFYSYYLTNTVELAAMAEEAEKRLPSRAIFEPETSSQISRSALDRLSSREVGVPADHLGSFPLTVKSVFERTCLWTCPIRTEICSHPKDLVILNMSPISENSIGNLLERLFAEIIETFCANEFSEVNKTLDLTNPVEKNLRKRYKTSLCLEDIYILSITLCEKQFHKEIVKTTTSKKIYNEEDIEAALMV